MSPRNEAALMVALRQKSKLSDRQLRRLISERANQAALSRPVAALDVARDYGVSISRFATTDQLAELRHANSGGSVGRSADPVPAPTIAARSSRGERGVARAKRPKRTHDNSVWVVHGRDEEVRSDFFSLLRAMGLNPIEWNKGVSFTKKGAPYPGEVLDAAFQRAAAVVVLLTADEVAMLKPEFRRRGDPTWEGRLTGQPRPNVLFEAGMAFGSHPGSTVLVQVGKVREFSNVAGRHVVRLSNSGASRDDLAAKLTAAGCRVDFLNSDWRRVGNFERKPTANRMSLGAERGSTRRVRK